MNKILGSAIAAVALLAGTTAFIGSQMETNLQKHFDMSNKLYANSGIKYKINSYEKSFLASTATVEIEILDPTVKALLKDSFKLPITMEYKIEHGPIFFKNGLGFGAAKTHQEIALSSLLTDETKTEFLSLIKDDVLITSDTVISFLKNANYKVSSDAIQINRDGKDFQMTPLSIKGDINLDTLKGDGKFQIDSLTLKEANSTNGLELKNLLMNVNIEEFIEKTLMVGTVDLSIDNLIIKDDSNPQLENIDIATNLHMTTKRNSPTTISTNMSGTVDFKDTKLPAELPNLKNIQLKMNMEEVGIEGMLAFQKASQEMQKSQSELMAKMQSNPSEEEMQKIFEEFGTLQQTMMSKIVNTLNTLLIKDKTHINYALDMETKDNKTSNASIDIGYTGDMKFEGSMEDIAIKLQQKALDIISLDVNLGLDTEHLSLLPNAETLKQQIQMGVAQGFVKEEKGKFMLNGYYKNQELIVNENNLTSSVLPLLMMATQGGGF